MQLIRAGDYRTALADVDHVDTVITDPPFSARTHSGAAADRHDGHASDAITYQPWDAFDVADFIDAWAQRIRLWIFVMTDHVLWPHYEARAQRADLVTFAPIPLVIPGMTVRLRGDGPSSWTIWGFAARRRGIKWRTLPGAYVTPRQHVDRAIGDGRGKPTWLCHAIARDYSDRGHLVCDPCAGTGAGLRAALELGRRVIGAELDVDVAATADRALTTGHLQPALL